MARRSVLSRLLLCAASCGAIVLLARGETHFVLAVYGAGCGAVVGAVRQGTRGWVEGWAFGLLAGMVSPIVYGPLPWLFGLPMYPPGRRHPCPTCSGN